MAGERSATVFYVDTNHYDSDQNIDALLSGQMWNTSSSNIVSFSFPDAASDYSYYPGVTFANGFTTTQQEAVRNALAEFADVIDIQFVEIGDDPGENNANGTLRYAEFNGLSAAFGYFPNSYESGGDMAFADGPFDSAPLGSYAFFTFMHETGHAMGLKHGHENSAGPGFPNVGTLTPDADSMEFSVMTYHSFIGQSNTLNFYTNAAGHYAQTLMMFDIAALQRMYGPDWDHNSGNTVYTFDPSTGETFYNGVGQGTPTAPVIFRTEWDGGGVDTYDLSNFTTKLRIDLRPGESSDFDAGGNALRARLNDGWAPDGSWGGSAYREYAGDHVYNALQYLGSTQSLIERAIGGTGNDHIRGNQVNNRLDGNAGLDTLIGAGGNDRAYGGQGNDSVEGNSGHDTLFGDAGDDVLDGGTGNDRIKGGADNDTIRGGDGADFLIGQNGVDEVDGGDGGDTLQGNNGNDTLDGQGGNDVVKGGYNWDDVAGGVGDDTVNGQRGNDRVEGNIGNDSLLGEDGKDTLVGGAGLDTLLGGNGNDFLNGGADNDTLMGGAGRDTLLGGAGDDLLLGGNGPDLFRFEGNVPSGNDTVDDFVNGTDRVKIGGGVQFADLTIDQSTADTVITWANGSLTLTGESGLIDGDDFLFG